MISNYLSVPVPKVSIVVLYCYYYFVVMVQSLMVTLFVICTQRSQLLCTYLTQIFTLRFWVTSSIVASRKHWSTNWSEGNGNLPGVTIDYEPLTEHASLLYWVPSLGDMQHFGAYT